MLAISDWHTAAKLQNIVQKNVYIRKNYVRKKIMFEKMLKNLVIVN